MLCAGSDRTESIDRRFVSTTASRPPKASATISFDPSEATASSRGQNDKSRVPMIESAGCRSDGARRASPTNVSRRDQSEATMQDRTIGRHDEPHRVGADFDPIDDSDLSV